jgi:MSHA biogenesis protein MshJ
VSPLQQQWLALSMRIDNLQFRERLLVFGAAVTVLLTALYVGLIEPSLKQQQLVRATTDGLAAELATLREQLAAAERASQSDQDSEAARTAAAITATEKEIEILQSRMLGPGEVTRLLKALLAEQALTLLALSTDAAQPALPPAPDAPADPNLAPGTAPPVEPFFKHRITLRAAGSYDSVTAYLARLEQMPWTLRWESVRIDATQHPRLELTVKLDSISREPAWSQL